MWVDQKEIKFTASEQEAVAKFHLTHQRAVMDVCMKSQMTVHNGRMFLDTDAPAAGFWPWLRALYLHDPGNFARMIGIPALASIDPASLPHPSLKLEHLLAVYEKENPSTPHTKRQVIANLRRMMSFTGAKTLERTDTSHDW